MQSSDRSKYEQVSLLKASLLTDTLNDLRGPRPIQQTVQGDKVGVKSVREAYVFARQDYKDLNQSELDTVSTLVRRLIIPVKYSIMINNYPFTKSWWCFHIPITEKSQQATTHGVIHKLHILNNVEFFCLSLNMHVKSALL